ncbi:MAG: ABC transporter ATP-binding protein [Frankiaceae bacterium]
MTAPTGSGDPASPVSAAGAVGRPPAVRVSGVHKWYRRAAERVHALRGVDLELHAGEVVALIGPSGSGKSTLLNVLCGWERPDDGVLELGEGFSARDPARLPWSELSIVPQALGLLEDLTVRENVGLPARLVRRHRELAERVDALLARFGIDHLAERMPYETSLGEQQRTAVARALVLSPRLVLADEPSSHQDARRSAVVYEALREAAAGGAAVLVATHDEEAYDYLDRILEVREGELRLIAA